MRCVLRLVVALTFVPLAASAQQPCTTDARRVVDELYRHMLERGADAASADSVRQLESGRVTVQDLVRSFAKSAEHNQRFFRAEPGEETRFIRSVDTLYRHILGRPADSSGARVYAEMAQRDGVARVADELVSSSEYREKFGAYGVPGSGGLVYCSNNSNNQGAAGTTGTAIVVSAAQRWTDTGIVVSAGDRLMFDAQGSVRLSEGGDDTASPSGSRTGRRAQDAPLPQAPAGGLIARIGNSAPVYIGDRRVVRAPVSGRLHLGVNDDHLLDNQGDFRVTVDVRNR